MSYPDQSHLAATVLAHREQLPRLRDRMRRWLTRQDIPAPLRADIVLAADEALANSVEHAYRLPAEPGTMDLDIVVHPDFVSVSVIDHGSWKPATPDPASNRGRGLRLIRALARHVDVRPTPHGTTLTAYFSRIPTPQAPHPAQRPY
ncbi:ATP-binding protein [Actinophytocola oryzae]|uniref:ATP-binding protein n=1 Tax=Actinophytocola oryzae TaxID=502181 RepID=UPI00141521CA|nr:ATP-binding protein [Actinophytocola oryzae]